ncbi:MAG: hypothetical protein V3R84_01530 [Acidimicrobiia bacterium]
MPIFPVPPVGPEDGGDIHEVVREIVGNRNYSRTARFGEGKAPGDDEGIDLPRRPSLRHRLRSLFRR